MASRAMEHIKVDGVSIHFAAEERDAAELIRGACSGTVRLLRKHWDLRCPAECRIYVMTSWCQFVFQSAPWAWRLVLLPTFPLWARRARAVWPIAGGWEQSYGRRHAVGIKPPRLIRSGGVSVGDRIFLPEPDPNEKLRSIVCHELTHAFTAELHLPMWFKEGVAMIAVDRFYGRPTVKQETIHLLGNEPDRFRSTLAGKLPINNQDEIVYTYAKGYWLTRYLEETRPDLVKELLSSRLSSDLLETRIAGSHGKSKEWFRQNINELLIAHFAKSNA